MPFRAAPLLAALFVGLFLLASGCASACPAALLEGTLVRDERSGLGVRSPDVDVTYPVEWPDGTTVEEVDGVRQLVDSGRVLGAEGDAFSAGGGFTPGPVEVFQPCGGIEITRAGP